MGSIPEAEPGLIFRYDYLRLDEARSGVENGKERPACLLLGLKEGEVLKGARFFDELSGEIVVDYTARRGDVLILLIQTDPPNADQLGARLSFDTKRLIGLRTTGESYIILSEINVDTWPSPGIKNIPNRPGSFAYPGRLPGPLLSAVARTILRLREQKLLVGVVRHP